MKNDSIITADLTEQERKFLSFYRSSDDAKLLIFQALLQCLIDSGVESSDIIHLIEIKKKQP